MHRITAADSRRRYHVSDVWRNSSPARPPRGHMPPMRRLVVFIGRSLYGAEADLPLSVQCGSQPISQLGDVSLTDGTGTRP